MSVPMQDPETPVTFEVIIGRPRRYHRVPGTTKYVRSWLLPVGFWAAVLLLAALVLALVLP